MRPRIAVAIVAAVALIVLALAATALAASQATHPKLLGVVGKNDAFKISLTSKGKVVKTLKAGTYTVVIQDDSTIHNYELDGPQRQVVDVHVGRLQGNEDDHAQAREGQVQGLLRAARVVHVPALHCRLTRTRAEDGAGCPPRDRAGNLSEPARLQRKEGRRNESRFRFARPPVRPGRALDAHTSQRRPPNARRGQRTPLSHSRKDASEKSTSQDQRSPSAEGERTRERTDRRAQPARRR